MRAVWVVEKARIRLSNLKLAISVVDRQLCSLLSSIYTPFSLLRLVAPADVDVDVDAAVACQW